MRLCMLLKACRRGHIDDAFDKLGLLEVRHGLIGPLELGTREPVTALK
jgi:hypothetical protein